MNLIVGDIYNTVVAILILTQGIIPYSRKYWRGIKFGGLAVLEASRQIKIRQYIVTCAKTDRRFTMLRYFKRSRSSVCPSKVPFLTDEELRCASKM